MKTRKGIGLQSWQNAADITGHTGVFKMNRTQQRVKNEKNLLYLKMKATRLRSEIKKNNVELNKSLKEMSKRKSELKILEKGG